MNGYHPSYNTSTNRIVGLTYDAVGNLTQDGTKTMGYDANNKLVSATATGGGTVSYLYDASGSRVSKTVGSTTTWYIYGLDGELVAEYGAQGAVGSPQKEYGYRGGQMLVVYDSTEVGNKQFQWLVQDHLGSTRMVADLSGSLTGMKRHDYLPFGEEIGAGVGIRTAGQGYPPPDDKVRQKFTGYERDGETGLDYAQARMYANVQGRFTSVDPVPVTKENFVNPQRWNQYNYVNNNPMSHFDPNGADGKGKGGDKVITVVMSLAVDEKGRGKHATNWNEVKEKAKANGYKLEMIEGGKPSQTREAIATALKTSEVVIFVSHGAAESRSPGEPYVQKGIWAAGNYYSSKGVTAMSDVPSIGQIEVLAKPEVSANVVCNFSCDAKGKTDSYFNFTGQNQTVVEANGGVGGQTSTSTLEAAAAAFAGTYKGNVATATNAANKTVQNQAKYQDLNGDLVNNDGDRIERRRATKR